MKFNRKKNTINAAVLSAEQITTKYGWKMRVGKTKRDHDSGAWKQRFANREARAQWQHTTFTSAEAAMKAFPGAN